VIKNVGENEGIEITMNCNWEAFEWVIGCTKVYSNYESVVESGSKRSNNQINQ
jgi:hypothetical protein